MTAQTRASDLISLRPGAVGDSGTLGGQAPTLEDLGAGEPPEDTGAQVTKQPRRTRGRGRYIRRRDHDYANRQG